MAGHVVVGHVGVVLGHQDRAIRPDEDGGKGVVPGIAGLLRLGDRQAEQGFVIKHGRTLS